MNSLFAFWPMTFLSFWVESFANILPPLSGSSPMFSSSSPFWPNFPPCRVDFLSLPCKGQRSHNFPCTNYITFVCMQLRICSVFSQTHISYFTFVSLRLSGSTISPCWVKFFFPLLAFARTFWVSSLRIKLFLLVLYIHANVDTLITMSHSTFCMQNYFFWFSSPCWVEFSLFRSLSLSLSRSRSLSLIRDNNYTMFIHEQCHIYRSCMQILYLFFFLLFFFQTLHFILRWFSPPFWLKHFSPCWVKFIFFSPFFASPTRTIFVLLFWVEVIFFWLFFPLAGRLPLSLP